MKIKVKNYDLWEFLEVFEILEMKDGCIYKVKSTGKFISIKFKDKLPSDFTTSSPSTSLLDKEEVELDIYSGELL